MSQPETHASHAETRQEDPSLPLSGITVIDLSHVYNGPYATFLMAMAGADVIKVEPPGGEHLRSRGDLGGAALPFAMLNSCKRSVTLNLKSDGGKALLREMVTKSDVLVENFAPGVMDRLGLGGRELLGLNPRLVYGSSSGYGKSGPYRDYPAMDLVVQAMSGVIGATGYADQPPVKCGAAVCDFSAGVHLYGAIVTALYQRERTGKGQIVEVAMQDAIYASLASNLGMLHARGRDAPARTGNKHGGLGIAPYNAYQAADGWVVINCPGDRHFRAVLDIIGRADLAHDERFATRAARVANMVAVDELVEGWTRTRSRDEIAEQMLGAAVPCAAVRDLAEVIEDRNMHARGSLQWIEHPELGRVVLPHSAMVYEGLERRPLSPSRPLGADRDRVFGDWLGHSADELVELARKGAF